MSEFVTDKLRTVPSTANIIHILNCHHVGSSSVHNSFALGVALKIIMPRPRRTLSDDARLKFDV